MLQRARLYRASAIVALSISMFTSSASAETTPQQAAAAQALFDEARKLMAQGAHAEACPKLEESQRLDPGVGTQLNLAACYEAIGRTASAWSLFLEAAALANRTAERQREQIARERAAQLERRLSKLRVIVPQDVRTIGLRVERADAETAAVMGPAQWGSAMPIDPGKHVVRATAPGKRPAQLEVEVPADGATYTITLSPLRDAPQLERKAKADEEPGFFEALGTQRVIGLSLGAAGVVALGVSGVFTLLAVSANDASQNNCEGNACNTKGLGDREDAMAHGDRATVALIGGGVLIAAGAVLFATGAPNEEQPTVQALLGDELIGASVKGAF
jgi:serine/threonine-protein kinase